MTNTPLYDAARYYTQDLGFSVIPVVNGDKRPAVPWTEFQNRKPTNEELTEWFFGHDYQLGVVCGAVSGNLVVLDFETPESYVEWAKRHPVEADTRTVETGKGIHVYLRTREPPAGNTKLIKDLVETRGEGGMVLAPPSRHPSGRFYKLRGGRKPVRVTTWAAISEGETWGEKRHLSAESAAVTIAQGVKAGSRNDSLFEAACLLRDGGRSPESALAVLLESNGRNDPPLPRDEVERTVKSAFSQDGKAPKLQAANEAMVALAALKEQQDAWIDSLVKTPRAPEPEWFELLKKIILVSKMTRAEIDTFIAEVESPPMLVKRKKTALKNIWLATRNTQAAQQILSAAHVGERPPTWPYDVKGGRLVYLSERQVYETSTLTSTPIADFRVSISHEINEEMGSKIFMLDGHAIRGGPFCLEVGAEEFGNDRKLKAMLDGASGSLDPVRAGMAKHLGPAIKLLTKQDECKKVRRYKRTGWTDDYFLIPGRPKPGIEIALDEGLVYRVDEGDLRLGLSALDALLESMGPERTTVPAALAFQAPLAQPAGWTNERYAVFIAGRTGSLKTSFAQVLMCLYGSKFAEDRYIQKWGDGATANARMNIASSAHDLPLLIDNYKPGTGGGAAAFISLIHIILEGAEKMRLNRNAELRKSRPLMCWPLCTGEDVPDGDPASLARILVVTLEWQRGTPNDSLTKAQELAEHLPVVGNAWLAWLEADAGQEAAARISSKFFDRRAHWATVLQGIRQDSVNVLRVASNLATNELTWEILCEHPAIGTVARKHKNAHATGLRELVAVTMAETTAEALEATRYIAALKELLATRKAIIGSMDDTSPDHERDRLIGWQSSVGIYLLPGIARKTVDALLSEGLNGISNLALNKQLDALGLIASKKKGQYTKPKRIGQRVERVLHLVADVFDIDEDDDEYANDGERIAAEIPL